MHAVNFCQENKDILLLKSRLEENSASQLNTMDVEVKKEPLDWAPEVSADPLSNLPNPESAFVQKPKVPLTEKQLGSLTCKFCHKLFSHRSNVLKHVRAVHKKVRYQCPQCMKIFNQEQTLKNHIKTVHEGMQHKCDLCDKSYNYIAHLKRHIESAHRTSNSPTFPCPTCGKEFNSKDTLDLHMKVIHQGIRLPCPHCDKEFSYQTSLKQHIQSVHDQVKITCGICAEEFSYDTNLQRHMMIKHNGVRYPCEQCDKIYSSNATLQWHIKTQHEGLKLKCDYCNSYFTHKTNLFRHLDSIHPLAEKPKTMELMKVIKSEEGAMFKCQFCHQEFLKETSLKIHMGHAHSSSDAKTCKECSRVFKTPGQLQTHVTNVHAKVKKWCEICNKHISQAFFRMHNATVHNGKKATCQICNKSISYYNIRKHQNLCQKKLQTKHSKKKPILLPTNLDLQIEIDDAEKDIVESSSPAQEIELDELLQDFEESEELLDDSYDLEESPPGSVETHDIIDDEVIENDDTSITLEITMK